MRCRAVAERIAHALNCWHGAKPQDDIARSDEGMIRCVFNGSVRALGSAEASLAAQIEFVERVLEGEIG
jgi:hypothetical protein